MANTLAVDVEMLESVLDAVLPCETFKYRAHKSCGNPAVARIKAQCTCGKQQRPWFVCEGCLEEIEDGNLNCWGCMERGRSQVSHV